jgi:hypothetical protein
MSKKLNITFFENSQYQESNKKVVKYKMGNGLPRNWQECTHKLPPFSNHKGIHSRGSRGPEGKKCVYFIHVRLRMEQSICPQLATQYPKKIKPNF